MPRKTPMTRITSPLSSTPGMLLPNMLRLATSRHVVSMMRNSAHVAMPAPARDSQCVSFPGMASPVCRSSRSACSRSRLRIGIVRVLLHQVPDRLRGRCVHLLEYMADEANRPRHESDAAHHTPVESDVGGDRADGRDGIERQRSEEHTSDSSHVKISYAVFCLKKK